MSQTVASPAQSPLPPGPGSDGPPAASADIARLAKALSGVKRRINCPKMPNDACYAGVGYGLPDPPQQAGRILFERLGPLPVGMSLDRIDPFGDYTLPNLRYATPTQQTANRRPPRKRNQDDEEFDE